MAVEAPTLERLDGPRAADALDVCNPLLYVIYASWQQWYVCLDGCMAAEAPALERMDGPGAVDALDLRNPPLHTDTSVPRYTLYR